MEAKQVTIVAVLLAVVAVAPAGAAPIGPDAGTVAVGSADVHASAGSVTVVSAAEECSFPVEVNDATNSEVRVERDPERVVTLAPSAAQTMWEIGASDEVVGVSQYATYLDGADSKANVSAAGYGNYATETIVSLEPDLVLAPNVVPNQTVTQLRQAGLTVVKFSKATSIDDVRKKTTLIGRVTGNCEGAAATNRWMDRNLDAVQSATQGGERPGAIYVFGAYTAGSNTFIHDLIRAAGARNVMAQAGVSGYKPVNKEVVAERDPSWIVLNNPKSGIPEQAPYNSTTAGREGNVVVINPNYISQPAPRSVVYAVRNLTEGFHGDAYGRSDYVSRSAVETTTTTGKTVDTTTTTTADTSTADTTSAETTASTGDPSASTTTETTPSQSTPGFSGGVAVLGVAAALLLARRRRSR